MSNAPVRATPRPLLHGLADLLHAWLEPSPERQARTARSPLRSAALRAEPPATRHDAALDVPTYQRRGIRISGLDDA
jgi:hypothetical protein